MEVKAMYLNQYTFLSFSSYFLCGFAFLQPHHPHCLIKPVKKMTVIQTK